MMNENDRKKLEQMLAKQELEYKGLGKELGLNLGDEEDDDPELAHLNEMLAKQGKISE